MFLQRQIDTMTLKDILIHGDEDIRKKNAAICALASMTKRIN